jgi:hypothetical protein
MRTGPSSDSALSGAPKRNHGREGDVTPDIRPADRARTARVPVLSTMFWCFLLPLLRSLAVKRVARGCRN